MLKRLLIAALCCVLAGCRAPAPVPFETGEVTGAPLGCVLAKVEGRDVDC